MPIARTSRLTSTKAVGRGDLPLELRLGLAAYPSQANFVLVHAGAHAEAIVEALRVRGIAVRDKSTAPGCAGCIRITTGAMADTARLVAALEDAWRELPV